MEDLSKSIWLISDVAEAAEIPLNTLRSQIARGYFPCETGQSRTAPKTLTGWNAIAVAIAAELVKIGVPIISAARAGVEFGHLSEGKGGWTGAPDNSPTRFPGELFSGEGVIDTVIVLDAEGGCKTHPVRKTTRLADIVPDDGAVAVLMLSTLVRRFWQRLDIIVNRQKVHFATLEREAQRRGFRLVRRDEE